MFKYDNSNTQNIWGGKLCVSVIEKMERILHKWLILNLEFQGWAGEYQRIKR